jgi:hypothetical protein
LGDPIGATKRTFNSSPVSHRPRKRFGQKCCPGWFLCGFRGVEKQGMRVADEFGVIRQKCMPETFEEHQRMVEDNLKALVGLFRAIGPGK